LQSLEKRTYIAASQKGKLREGLKVVMEERKGRDEVP